MSGSENVGVPNPRVPLGLGLEQARELGKGNAIHQLQQNYQALSTEVAQLATDLQEILTHLEKTREEDGEKLPWPPRDEPLSSHSCSSHDDETPRRGRRPPRQQVDDLSDMQFDPSEFEGNLNPEVFLEWKLSIKRFFEIKEYTDEKAFKVVVLKLKKYASI